MFIVTYFLLKFFFLKLCEELIVLLPKENNDNLTYLDRIGVGMVITCISVSG